MNEGTDYVFLKCVKAQYLAPGRGFSEGSGVFTDAAKDRRKHATKAVMLWKVAMWDPLADLQDLIVKVEDLVSTASVGTAYNQVPNQSDIDALSEALTTAQSTYNTMNSDYGSTPKTTLMETTAFTSAMSTAVRNLMQARATYLGALNPLPDNLSFRFVHEATGKVLEYTGNATQATLNSRTGSEV